MPMMLYNYYKVKKIFTFYGDVWKFYVIVHK